MKRPYIEKNNIFISFFGDKIKKHHTQLCVYITDEEAIQLNEIGEKINNLKEEQENLLKKFNQ